MNPTVHSFWLRWLVLVNTGVILFGLGMVLVPQHLQALFSWMLFYAPDRVDAFGPQAVGYIMLLTGILGAVMVGWGVALMFTILGPFQQGLRYGWNTVALSIGGWFVPDTLFSLHTGFWQNAVFNLVFLVLFAIPLAATCPRFRAAPATGKNSQAF